MQKVEYVYKGPDSKKLVVSGNEAVVIQGDSNSTEFDFRFPEEYKGYSKAIDWGFKYDITYNDYPVIDENGEFVYDETGKLCTETVTKKEPAIFFLDNDRFRVNEIVTQHFAGMLATFTIVFYGSVEDKEKERSLPSSVYITKTTDEKYDDVEDISIWHQLISKALETASFNEINKGDERPSLHFSTIGSSSFDVPMEVPYLVDGVVDKRFIPYVPTIEEYVIEWSGMEKEWLSSAIPGIEDSIISVEDSLGNRIVPATSVVKIADDTFSLMISCSEAPPAGTIFKVRVIKEDKVKEATP